MVTRRQVLSLASLSMAALGSSVVRQAFAAASMTKLVVGFQPGGGFDNIARILAERLKSHPGGSVVIVENKVGAAGRLAVETVKNSPKDGMTLLLTPSPVLTLAPHTAVRQTYDPLRDLVMIARLASFDYGFAVSSDTKITSLKQYIEAVRKNRDLGTYGSPGAGLTPHFVGMILARETGLNLLHVPYKGTSAALQDAMGNQIAAVCATAPALAAAQKGGRIRVLATTGTKRNPDLPDVPTFAEAGIKNLIVEDWAALCAPAGTPKAVVDKINAAVMASLADPRLQEQFRMQGFYPNGSSPDEAAALLKTDYENWRSVVKAVGFKETE